MRTIYIAGLAFDYEQLHPLKKVSVYNNQTNELLGTTDANGYFNVKLSVPSTGAITFSLLIKGNNYKSLIQNERWGDIPGNQEAVYFFAMGIEKRANMSFTELNQNVNGRAYEDIAKEFKEIKKQIHFDKKMQAEIEKSQNVFLEIDGVCYIVSDTGWIQLTSKNDLISINDTEGVPAFKVNALIKREEIKNMTTSNSPKAAVFVYRK